MQLSYFFLQSKFFFYIFYFIWYHVFDFPSSLNQKAKTHDRSKAIGFDGKLQFLGKTSSVDLVAFLIHFKQNFG